MNNFLKKLNFYVHCLGSSLPFHLFWKAGLRRLRKLTALPEVHTAEDENQINANEVSPLFVFGWSLVCQQMWTLIL